MENSDLFQSHSLRQSLEVLIGSLRCINFVFICFRSLIKNEYRKDLTFSNSEVHMNFINSLSNEAPNDDYALTHKENSVFT